MGPHIKWTTPGRAHFSSYLRVTHGKVYNRFTGVVTHTIEWDFRTIGLAVAETVFDQVAAGTMK